jgi:hypothetical protein
LRKRCGKKKIISRCSLVKPHNFKGEKWAPKIRLDDDDGWEDEDEHKKQPNGKAGEVGVRIGNFRANDYALGEYGFPDDGYDYTKHFRVPGGGKWLAAAGMGDLTAAVRANKKVDLMDQSKPKDSIVDFGNGKGLIVKENLKAEEHQFSDADEDEQEVMKMLEESASEEEGWELADDFIAAAMDVKPPPQPKKEKKKKSPEELSDRVRFADADFDDEEDEDSD